VVADGLVYIGGNDGAVHAFETTAGAPRWSSNRFPARRPTAENAYDLLGLGPTSSLTVADGVVYAAGRDGQLHALDAPTGVEKWTAPIGTTNQFGSAPAVMNGLVYVQTDALHALDAATGAERWVTATGNGLSIYAFVPPVVSGGTVYVAGGDARLHEIDAATGASRGAAGRVPPPPKRTPLVVPAVLAVAPAIASDVVYLGSGDHRIYAYRVGM
jgi:eukaryotic-like serine/threonine-protein kinase